MRKLKFEKLLDLVLVVAMVMVCSVCSWQMKNSYSNCDETLVQIHKNLETMRIQLDELHSTMTAY